jgi:hypothetical protein
MHYLWCNGMATCFASYLTFPNALLKAYLTWRIKQMVKFEEKRSVSQKSKETKV